MSVNSHSAAHAAPRKRPRQERSRRTVQRILDEAARIFDRDGYRSTTTNAVAEASGVSIGSLYQYFPNKDALLAGLAERHLADVVPRFAELADRLERERPGPDALARLVVELAASVNDRPLHALLHDAPRTERVVEQFDRFRNETTAQLSGHLERFGLSPELAHARARLIVTVVDAVVHDEADLRGDGAPPVRDELVRLVAWLASDGAHQVP